MRLRNYALRRVPKMVKSGYRLRQVCPSDHMEIGSHGTDLH
jgi:hypothetical protein